MNALLESQNLLTYSLQLGVLIGVAAAVPPLLRLKVPGARLLYWQCVLLASLVMPLLRGWRTEVITTTALFTPTVHIAAVSAQGGRPAGYSWPEAILMGVAAGLALRLLWLCAGLWRLRRYRANSRPLEETTSLREKADLRLSDEITSPVTFGFRNPVILLPSTFTSLAQSVQEAILCHEMLHVRRHDWLFTMGEELVRALFWFHPAIWWLLGEIQLTREQAVDDQVIQMTRSRDRYVDALLAIAGATSQLDLAPAPLFLRKRHLKQRVVSILKEVRMSKTRTVSALAAGIAMLAASCWLITGALPLQAAPQIVADAQGVTVEMNGAQLMHRSSVAYPRDAAAKGIQGTVVVQVKLDSDGNVADASVLSGPDELRKTVLESVLNWHFSHDAALSSRQVSVSFVAPKAGEVPGPSVAARIMLTPSLVSRPAMMPEGGVLKKILVVGLPDAEQARLIASLPVHEGQTLSASDIKGMAEAVHKFDEHLVFGTGMAQNGEVNVIIRVPPSAGMMNAPPPPPPPPPPASMQSDNAMSRPIRVGANVAAANLVSQTKPEYPPIAKEARIQGTVAFEAIIGTDGHIENLHLLSGPPLLVQAALQAVQQWVYRPTLLNGNPVQVITVIDVNFTLAQ